MFVCVQCKTSASFRCDLPIPVSGIVVAFGTVLVGFDEKYCGIAFHQRSRAAFPVMALRCGGGLCGLGVEKTTSPQSAI